MLCYVFGQSMPPGLHSSNMILPYAPPASMATLSCSISAAMVMQHSSVQLNVLLGNFAPRWLAFDMRSTSASRQARRQRHAP